MKVGSLFSGIGGLELGFERAGMEVVFQVEIDKAASSVLERHWPNVKRYKDVKEVTRERLEADLGGRADVDVLVGGFPCQDVSLAGRRAGLAGKRSGLFHEFARLVEELAPRWLVVENVPGLLSSNGGRDMGTVLGSLAELGYGYAYRVLDAQYMGVPQRRRRVFIVGHLGAPWSSSAQVLFEPDSGEGDPPACVEEGEDDADGAGEGTDERGVVRVISSFTPVSGGPDDNDAQAGHLVVERTFVGDGWGEDVARTLTSPAHGPHYDLDTENFVVDGEPWALNAGQENIWEQGITPAITGSKGNPGAVTYRKVHRAHNVEDAETWDKAEVANTLNTFDNGDIRSTQVVVGFSTKDYGGDAAEELAPTVRSMNFDQSHINGGGQAGVAVDLSVRRLTPLECERLQGFPDLWTDGQSDTARYRQLGNAVAVVCSSWIAKRLVEVDQLIT